MENPERVKGRKLGKALLLNTTNYRLVQAARQYYKKAVSILTKIGFTGGNVDLCLEEEEHATCLCGIIC